MKVAVLFSGGKDSSLAALLLEPFFEEIELINFSFGHDDSWMRAKDAAGELGYPLRRMIFSEDVLESSDAY
jgi:predicted subunit of tRNA(5-methylaminomethyl-2-thiouridylate) methyltransferase